MFFIKMYFDVGFDSSRFFIISFFVVLGVGEVQLFDCYVMKLFSLNGVYDGFIVLIIISVILFEVCYYKVGYYFFQFFDDIIYDCLDGWCILVN